MLCKIGKKNTGSTWVVVLNRVIGINVAEKRSQADVIMGNDFPGWGHMLEEQRCFEEMRKGRETTREMCLHVLRS